MNYRTRKITFHTKYNYEITYDGRFRAGSYGSTQDALKEANHMMDIYGFKKAEIIDDNTGEVIATIENEEL